uniref:Uncharacterized protein n=1 Tax=Magallana gigas TaxID=29159 RepID=K1Q2T2_MAGGI
MLENELERAEQKKAELEIQLTEKEHELQETKIQLEDNRNMMKRMESEMEKWPDTDFVQKQRNWKNNWQKKKKQLQEYKEKVKEMESLVEKTKDDVQRSRQASYDATDTGYFRAIQNDAERQTVKAKERLAFLEREVEKLKKDKQENVQIFEEILDEILPNIKDITEKTFTEAQEWIEAAATGKQREAWSIYFEPKIATEEKFKSLKEHCKKFCFVRNRKNHNISGLIQLKETLNIDKLIKLLRPNIYLNGRPKEDIEKWAMAAKFNEKDYFSINFTDETKKGGDKVACEIRK